MRIRIKPLFFVVTGGLVLASCDLQGPLRGGNALDPPGYNDHQPMVVEEAGSAYRPGDWVEASTPGAALYSRFPGPRDQPVRSLKMGTPMKVVSTQGTYAKVELESGAIGYVPAVMISPKRAAVEGATDSANILPLAPLHGGLAPDPEVEPLSVEDANGTQPRIDPAADNIE